MAIALITGTSTGLGLATAVTLARGGTMDVDDDASVRAAVAQALAQSGRIDVLVNNAGIGVHGSLRGHDRRGMGQPCGGDR